MALDIQEIQLLVAIVRDILTGLSAVTAAIVAVIGLQAWKKQLKGRTEYELAQRLLRGVYEVRNAFAEVRKPFTSSEVSRAKDDASIEGDRRVESVHIDDAIYRERWQEVSYAFIELHSLSLEAEALWGQIAKETLEPLNQCASKLFLNIQEHLKILEKTPEYYGVDFEENVYDVIGDSRDNLFTNEINESVKNVESFIKPRLKM